MNDKSSQLKKNDLGILQLDSNMISFHQIQVNLCRYLGETLYKL